MQRAVRICNQQPITAVLVLAPERALAQQAPEQVLAPEQALRGPVRAQELALRVPEQALVLLALGLAWWPPAVQQALAVHRFVQKYNKRQ
ncbi:hypothetical protein ABID19_002251 [Mesorhizobium robiniae]|uniref:Uncharacterized protein n=1 Tax=Mesorhizobium robiniae TaxID=559315 RepID=A0ABV2GLR3_9HYPH